MIAQALAFLKVQATSGFQEALDLQFGLFGHPVLIASVFQVSLIVTAMAAAAPSDPEVREIVAREGAAIAALGDEAGWRYFNLCAAIPPDADLLAQAIVAMAAADLPDRAIRLAGPIRLLEANARGAGRYRTWLVASPAEEVEADERWASAGHPIHSEVVANILHALLGDDPVRFRMAALAGAHWIASQVVDGTWESYWYYGRAYGTFQALRLFRAIARLWPDEARPFRSVQVAASRALLAAQHPSGGWIADLAPVGVRALKAPFVPPEEPGALETAYALAALAMADHADPEPYRRGRGFLAGLQDPDGSFPADPFYFTLGMVPYRSRCLTTAICLLAAGLRPA